MTPAHPSPSDPVSPRCSSAASSRTPGRPHLTVRTPEDLLAVVPVVLGFEPEESAVVLTFGRRASPPGAPPGPGGGPSDFHARVDLPDGEVGDEAMPGELDAMVDALVDPVARHRVGRLVVVVHSRRREVAELAGDRLLRALGERAPAAHVVEALHADGRRWWPLRVAGPRAARAGTPYDVTHHPLRLRAVVEGRIVHGSRGALAATLDADVAGRGRLEGLLRRGTEESGLRHPALGEAWVAVTVSRALTTGEPLDDATAVRLLLALQDGEARDAACAGLTRATAAEHVALWRDLLRRSPERLQAAPAALLGLAAWVSGDGALAWCALDRCFGVDHDHALASLVATALQRAVPPSAWEGVTGAATVPAEPAEAHSQVQRR